MRMESEAPNPSAEERVELLDYIETYPHAFIKLYQDFPDPASWDGLFKVSDHGNLSGRLLSFLGKHDIKAAITKQAIKNASSKSMVAGRLAFKITYRGTVVYHYHVDIDPVSGNDASLAIQLMAAGVEACFKVLNGNIHQIISSDCPNCSSPLDLIGKHCQCDGCGTLYVISENNMYIIW